MLLFLILFLFEGLLFMGLSLPLIQRRVKPNPWYGFRTPKTLSSERIWYLANEYSGRLLFVTGLIVAAAAILLTPLGLIPYVGIAAYRFGCTAVLIGCLILTLWLSFRYLRKL